MIRTGQIRAGEQREGSVRDGVVRGVPEAGQTRAPGLNVTLDDATMTGAVHVRVALSLNVTLDDATLDGDIEVTDPPGETLTITLVAATFDASDSAARTGTAGSNYAGAYFAINSATLGDHYFWYTHDGFGWDPGDYVGALAGFTGHEIALVAGNRTAAQVATATRTVLDVVYASVGGTGADAVVVDDIDAGSAFVGTSSPGTAASWGSRDNTTVFDSNPIAETIHAHTTGPTGPVLATAIGARLNSAGDLVRLAIYTGGSAGTGVGGLVDPANFVGTTLVLEATMTGSGTGWVWTPLTPAQAAELASAASLHLLLKGETTSTHASFTSLGTTTNTDLTIQPMCTLDTGDIDPDPTVAFPSTLDGVDVTASFAVINMIAFEYRTPPQRGDAGGITLA